MMGPQLWLVAAFALAVADWAALFFHKSQINYFTKPAVILALLAFFTFSTHWAAPYLVWFGLALILGLVGDVLLLLPERYFKAGGAAFLLGHVCLLVGFNYDLAGFTPTSLLVAVPLGMVAGAIYLGIRDEMKIHGYLAKQKPATAYICIITFMVLSACLTLFNPHWPRLAAGLAAAGALFFFASDMLLAYNRYGRNFPRGQLLIRILYHLGQMGIVSAVVVKYLSGPLH